MEITLITRTRNSKRNRRFDGNAVMPPPPPPPPLLLLLLLELGVGGFGTGAVALAVVLAVAVVAAVAGAGVGVGVGAVGAGGGGAVVVAVAAVTTVAEVTVVAVIGGAVQQLGSYAPQAVTQQGSGRQIRDLPSFWEFEGLGSWALSHYYYPSGSQYSPNISPTLKFGA